MGLDELLNQTTAEEVAAEEQKRAETIDTFQTLVRGLYATIENDWLHEYTANGKISLTTDDVNITEERLGPYIVPSLKISFLNRTVELIPKGTIMLGTDARIDVCYLGIARKMIVRAPEKMTSALQMVHIHIEGEKPAKRKDLGQKEWKLVDSSNRMSLLTLNKETFQQLLANIVTNG